MKRSTITLVFFTILSLGYSQKTVINSVLDGNWLMPTTWDCTCVPTATDNVNISNNVVLNTSWIVTSGSVTINTGASLVKDIATRTWVMNGGTLTNDGTFDVEQVGNYSGTIVNTGHMTVNKAFLNNSNLNNSGIIDQVDSLQNNSSITNTALGSITATHLWNNLTLMNAGNIDAVYFLNTSSFTNNGFLQASSYLNTNISMINDTVKVLVDFMNTGKMTLTTNVLFDVTHDFLNGDSLVHDASFINGGKVLIGNDFTNLDTIKGNLGYFCIASYSTNHGYITGTVDICDQTPLGGPPYIDLNTGTITASVTSCTHACNAGINENTHSNVSVNAYPNPFNDKLTFEFTGKVPAVSKTTLSVFDMLGQLVFDEVYPQGNITITRNALKSGVYFYKLQTGVGVFTGKLLAE